MAISIFDFFGSQVILLAVLLLVLILILIIIAVINKRLKKEVIVKEQVIKKEEFLKEELEKLKNSNKLPEEILKEADNLTREFFKEAFQIKSNLDYSEMSSIFKDKKRTEISSFCEQMIELLYSGKKPSNNQIKALLRDLEFIFHEEYPVIPIVPENQKIEESAQDEAEKIAKSLSETDVKKIFDSYESLQSRFQQIYKELEKKNDIENIKRLNKLKKAIIKRVEDYSKDKLKVFDLADEISKGERILDLITRP